eukprot:527268-Karenia_brevis.AAC.1
MAMMRRDRHVEGEVDAVILINRSREDLVQDLYVPRKYRTPYRGYPVVYDGKRGSTLQIDIKRADGVVEANVEKQMPGMESSQIKQLLAYAYP